MDLARSLSSYGELAEASDLIDEALPHWRLTSNLQALSDGLRIRAGLAWLTGHPEAAIAAGDEAVAIDESIGNLWGRAFSRLTVGVMHFQSGDVARGR